MENQQKTGGAALSDEDIRGIVQAACADWKLNGSRVLLVIPDHTRSCPMDLMFRLLHAELAGAVAQLDVMIALGTHPAMTMEAIYERVGITEDQHRTEFADVNFFNHAWDDPDQLVEVGAFTGEQIGALTDGLFEMDIPVRCNRLVHDYDELVIVGPVFPHEVAGFSGGNKYLFPGISGPEVLNFFHWLGAVITNPRIIGSKWTPVRKVIDSAAAMIPTSRKALCMVVHGKELAGLFFGTPEGAWSDASDLSAQLHVTYKEHPFHTVLSCAPKMYDEVWVGAKCMYKLEPVVDDGGTLIIYAPHIHEVAVVHDEVIKAIGYHTRDYFLKQWDDFKHHPWGILAHSTHVKGVGAYEDGVETPRINVVLATGISEAVCQQINLGYMNPDEINPADYMDREDEGILYVAKAGEMLYRLKNPPVELGGENEIGLITSE